jgi:uncharacterized protein (DUF302 family)
MRRAWKDSPLCTIFAQSVNHFELYRIAPKLPLVLRFPEDGSEGSTMDATASQETDGLIRVRSTLPFKRTVECLLIALKRRGMAIHARIDHAANAATAGLTLGPEELFIFNYPEAEGPILQRCPVLGLEFPRKILIWQDESGQVWMGYNDPLWLGRRFSVSEDVYTLLRALAISLTGIALEAGGKKDMLPLT